MTRLLIWFFLALGLSISVNVQSAPLPDDPSALLGYGLPGAIAERGSPLAVSVYRGPEPWQDDVVFQYEGGFSFFWFENHLWQIRFVAGYPGSVLGLFVGDAADKAISILGQPYRSTPEFLVFRLPWKGYPVQLRAALRDGRISELYVYRADY